MNLKNKRNLYADQLGDIFDECPKAVLAAIAVSFATTGGDFLSEARERIAEEWHILHQAGIVPQAPGPRTKCVPRSSAI